MFESSTLRTAVSLAILISSSMSFAEQPKTTSEGVKLERQVLPGGHGIGNGGDFVRSFFITTGYEVMNYLFQDEKGQAIVSDFNINVYSFQTVLSTRVIQTSSEPLTDVFGNQVDAIYSGGYLYLYTEAWERFLTSERDVHTLVFHEMLRATGHHDDDYVISRRLVIDSDFKSEDDDTSISNPLPPVINDGFVVCSCDPKGESIYDLVCKNAVTNKLILDDLPIIGIDNCKAEKNKVLKYYGQTPEPPKKPIVEELPRTYWNAITAHSGSLNNRTHNVDVSFKVEKYEQEFGLQCNFLAKSYMRGPNGASWRIVSTINQDACTRLQTALLVSTESNSVTIYVYEGWVKYFEFKL